MGKNVWSRKYTLVKQSTQTIHQFYINTEKCWLDRILSSSHNSCWANTEIQKQVGMEEIL